MTGLCGLYINVALRLSKVLSLILCLQQTACVSGVLHASLRESCVPIFCVPMFTCVWPMCTGVCLASNWSLLSQQSLSYRVCLICLNSLTTSRAHALLALRAQTSQCSSLMVGKEAGCWLADFFFHPINNIKLCEVTLHAYYIKCHMSLKEFWVSVEIQKMDIAIFWKEQGHT